MSENKMKQTEDQSHVRKEEEEEEEEKAMKIWDCGSPLYDAYELVTLSHIVERHFMVFPYGLTGSTNHPPTHHSSASVSSSLNQKSKRGETGSKKSGRSSLMSCFAGFMERNVLKRRIDGGRKEGAKKQKRSGISNIFAWRK